MKPMKTTYKLKLDVSQGKCFTALEPATKLFGNRREGEGVGFTVYQEEHLSPLPIYIKSSIVLETTIISNELLYERPITRNL